MKKLALFDFDKTIISVDSVVELKNFLSDKGHQIMNFDLNQIELSLPNETINFLNKLSWLNIFKGKDISFFRSEINEFVETVLLNKIIHSVYDELLRLQENGFYVIIISASYREILEVFCSKMNLNNIQIICTELKIKDNIFTAEIDGLNCSGINKVIKLKNEVPLNEFNLNESVAFTDHISDLSFLLLVKKRFVVHLNDTKDDWSHLFNVNYIQ